MVLDDVELHERDLGDLFGIPDTIATCLFMLIDLYENVMSREWMRRRLFS